MGVHHRSSRHGNKPWRLHLQPLSSAGATMCSVGGLCSIRWWKKLVMAPVSAPPSSFSTSWGEGFTVYPTPVPSQWAELTWNSCTRYFSTMARPQVWAANSSSWKTEAPGTARPETKVCSRQGTSAAGWSDLQGVGGTEGAGLGYGKPSSAHT